MDINYHQKANGNVWSRQFCREFQALQLWFYREMPRFSSFFNFYSSYNVLGKKRKKDTVILHFKGFRVPNDDYINNFNTIMKK